MNTTISKLIERYSALLFDAYGVLLYRGRAAEGAPELIEHLESTGKPYWIVSNNATQPVEIVAEEWGAIGLRIPCRRIITSGDLIASYFEEHGLRGCKCSVLGPEGSLLCVRKAGGLIVSPEEGAEVLVVCDEQGYPLLETIDRTIGMLFRQFDRSASVHLLLPNPDLIYPDGKGGYGITAGSIAILLEAILAQRYPDQNPRFVPFGKPYSFIFEEALRRSGTRDMVMIGDQIPTDILGARRFGIDSALVGTGVSRLDGFGDVRPTFVLHSLDLRE